MRARDRVDNRLSGPAVASRAAALSRRRRVLFG